MKRFVRKIERGKWTEKKVWMKNDTLNGGSPSADAVTGSLRTQNNTLSVWQIETFGELEDAVTAFVCQGQRLDTIDVVIFEESALSERHLKFQKEPADTPLKSFNDRHYDVCELDYHSLGQFSEVIVDSLRSKETTKRFTKAKLKELVKRAVADGKVALEDLNEKIASAVT